jgi:hypothetical protein
MTRCHCFSGTNVFSFRVLSSESKEHLTSYCPTPLFKSPRTFISNKFRGRRRQSHFAFCRRASLFDDVPSPRSKLFAASRFCLVLDKQGLGGLFPFLWSPVQPQKVETFLWTSRTWNYSRVCKMIDNLFVVAAFLYHSLLLFSFNDEFSRKRSCRALMKCGCVYWNVVPRGF